MLCSRPTPLNGRATVLKLPSSDHAHTPAQLVRSSVKPVVRKPKKNG
jgi:hypothetical protein